MMNSKEKEKRMGIYRTLLGAIGRRKLVESPPATVVLLPDGVGDSYDNKDGKEEEAHPVKGSVVLPLQKLLSQEELAAIKIQASFRRHLAKKAYRALKSLVKLQALVRGVYVRRQARLAVYTMHTILRLHIKVRERQLLSKAIIRHFS